LQKYVLVKDVPNDFTSPACMPPACMPPAGQHEHELDNEFEKQSPDSIDQCSRKNALSGIIPVRIDIKGEQSDIQHQARHRNGGDLAFVGTHEIQEISQRERGIEFDKIVDDQAHERGDQTQY
jgi:hypothetical protein